MRRLKRYSLAETKLAATLQKCAIEPSPQELQIRALEQATSVLSAHAKDSQETAERLRALLADRETDPETFEALQRDRWMQEKRQLAVDRESKVIHEYVLSLRRSSSEDESPSVAGLGPSEDCEAKRRANLIRFFGSSVTRVPIFVHKTAEAYPVDRAPRRMTMGDVTPMRSRTSSLISAFSQPIRGHSRSVSLDDIRSQKHRHASLQARPHIVTHMRESVGRTFGATLRTPLDVVKEDPTSEASTPSSPTPTTNSSIFPITQEAMSNTNTQCSTAPFTWDNEPSLKHVPVDGSWFFDNEDGHATIQPIPKPRSKAEITAGLEVVLPDYALDLFTEFDYTQSLPSDFSTQLVSHPSRSDSEWDIVSPSASNPISRRNTLSPSRFSRKAATLSHSPSASLTTNTPSRLRKTPSTSHISKKSHRQLGSLFAIPEAITSKLTFRDKESTVTPLPSLEGDVNTSHLSETTPPHDGGLASKVKRRLSVLRLK